MIYYAFQQIYERIGENNINLKKELEKSLELYLSFKQIFKAIFGFSFPLESKRDQFGTRNFRRLFYS